MARSPIRSTVEPRSTSAVRTTLSGIRRHRPSYCCEACRARRVKCDQVHPTCSSCKKYKIDCVYSTNALKKQAADRSSPESVKSQGRESVETKSSEPSSQQEKIGYLSVQKNGRSRYIENVFWACVNITGVKPSPNLAQIPLFPLDAFSQDGAKSTTGIPSASLDALDFAAWLAVEPEATTPKDRTWTKILGSLPAKKDCDELFRIFCSNVHPLMPLVHLPSMKRQYQEVWDNILSATDKSNVLGNTNRSFIPLLAAMLFAGSVVQSSMSSWSSPFASHNRTIRQSLFKLTSEALAAEDFRCSPTLESIAAFLLVQTLTMREDDSLESCSFISVAFRLAQAMGLHKDGLNFGLSTIEIETRRRIWNHIISLDVLSSVTSGLPFLVPDELAQSAMPMSELKDTELEMLLSPFTPSNNFDHRYVLTAGRHEVMRVVRKLLRRINASSTISLQEAKGLISEVDALSVRMEDRLKTVAAIRAKENPVSSETQDLLNPFEVQFERRRDEDFDEFLTSLSMLFVERLYCRIYQALMHDGTLWSALRPEAILRFQTFVAMFVRLCNSNCFGTFQWFYPGSFQPIQQASVLLIDLLQFPTSEEASQSKVMLESLCSQLSSGGRLTRLYNGNFAAQRAPSYRVKEAWRRLGALRRKVWKELGYEEEPSSESLSDQTSAIGWQDTLMPSADHLASPEADILKELADLPAWEEDDLLASVTAGIAVQ